MAKSLFPYTISYIVCLSAPHVFGRNIHIFHNAGPLILSALLTNIYKISVKMGIPSILKQESNTSTGSYR